MADPILTRLRDGLSPQQAKGILSNPEWINEMKAALEDIARAVPVDPDDITTKVTAKYRVGALGGVSLKDEAVARSALSSESAKNKEAIGLIVSHPSVAKFCLGITNVSPKGTLRASLVKRMSSGTRSYVARGYSHMILVATTDEREAIVAMEREMHDTFNSHSKWDKDTHNTKGGQPKTIPRFNLLYLAISTVPN